MANTEYYPNAVQYSLKDTAYNAVYDAADGSSSNPEWYKAMSELVSYGVKPIFNSISDKICATAWVDLVPKLGIMPNILSIKIALAAGVCTKEDMLMVFASNKEWIDQASFRSALGNFLCIHNTQLLPLSLVIGQEESTQNLIEKFSNPESAVSFLEENNIINSLD